MEKYSKKEWNWILYDGGNSAFTLLATTIIPLYFNFLTKAANITPSLYLAYFGYASSIVTLLVMVLGPIAGAISDKENMRKRVFSFFLLLGILFTILLSFASKYLMFLFFFIIAKSAYQLSLVVYDAMLIDVSRKENMDRVSSAGYAFGYILSCIPFVLSLAVIIIFKKYNLSRDISIKISFAINAIWWFLFSIPLLNSYEQRFFKEKEDSTSIFADLIETMGEILQNKRVLYFLIAFFFYIDGVYTIINMAVAYGGSLGLDSNGLLLALLLTQIVAFPAALYFGWLSKRVHNALLIKLCISAYFFITIFATTLDSLTKFWILAVSVGLFQGAVQALSRSYFGKIIPEEKSGKFFGIYDIFGKGAALMGTFLVSFISQITGNQSLGIMVLPVMFIVGMFFFIKSEKINAVKI